MTENKPGDRPNKPSSAELIITAFERLSTKGAKVGGSRDRTQDLSVRPPETSPV